MWPMGSFNGYTTIPFSWTHIVLNYIGPLEGTQGIRVYENGTLVTSVTNKSEGQRSQQESRVAIGKNLYKSEQFFFCKY